MKLTFNDLERIIDMLEDEAVQIDPRSNETQDQRRTDFKTAAGMLRSTTFATVTEIPTRVE